MEHIEPEHHDGTSDATPGGTEGKRRPGELIFSVFLLGACLFLVWSAWGIENPFGPNGLSSPRTIPLATTLVMAVTMLIVLIKTIKLPLDMTESLARDILPIVVLIIVALLVAYAFALRPLGFLPTSAAFLIISIKVLGKRNWGWTLAVSLVSLIIIWLIFRIVFSVLMPAGIFPEAELIQMARGLVNGGGRTMTALMDFLMIFAHPQLLVLVGVGTFAGVYIGAIPGLSVTMAVSILISFTFSWDVYSAIALMIGIYMGGVYGGSRTAILLNIPGAPSAIATALDGYPMALRGEAGTAIGVTTVMSFIGGFIGIIVLAMAAPLVSDFALKFQPRDYMLLAVLGILLVGSLSQGSLVKGIFAGALGIALGTVGRDTLTFAERFTFDLPLLQNGVSFIAVMIGMFGVSEALLQLHHVDKDSVRQNISRIVPSLASVKKHLPLSIQTSAIGVIIGALPGTGGDIAALMAYDHAKRVTKNPTRPFGKGAMEGLVAPESANNAAVGGAFIPMLTLGIPGDAVTAIMIGALYIHGLNPGPMLMVDKPDMFWFIVGCLVMANFFMLLFGLTGIKFFTKIVEMPRAVLIPLIMMLSIVGAYAVNNSITDIYWMLGFGVFGYFMRHYGYPLGPVILGVILSRLLDDNWRRAIISEREDFGQFMIGILTSPLSLILFISVILIFVSQTPYWDRAKARIFNKGKVQS